MTRGGLLARHDPTRNGCAVRRIPPPNSDLLTGSGLSADGIDGLVGQRLNDQFRARCCRRGFRGSASLRCPTTLELLDEGFAKAGALRMRPKALAVSVIACSHATGREVMQRIAAPMIGGMNTPPLLSVLVVPAAYRILRRRGPIALDT